MCNVKFNEENKLNFYAIIPANVCYDSKLKAILEKLEFNYTKDILEEYNFTKENIEKLKIIIYSIKELIKTNKRILLNKITRQKLIYIYDKCKNIKDKNENTEFKIRNFII